MSNHAFLTAIILAAASLGASPGGARAPGAPRPRLDTTARTYVLFLDMLEVERADNVELVLNAAAKHPNNPVLPLGDIHEWDSLAAKLWSGSLLYDTDERIFKCWYMGYDHANDLSHIRTGYAISKDGVVWEKPRLGLHEYQGSRENNIVHLTNDARVLKDDTEKDPARRYQMLSKQSGNAGNRGAAYYPFYSPDGIHWTPGPDQVVYPEMASRYGATEINHLLVDPRDPDPRRRIKMYGQGRFPSKKRPAQEVVRKIVVGYGPDIEHGTLGAANPILDPDDGLEHEMHFAEVFPYRSYYLMLYDYNLYMDYYGHGKWGNFVGDVRLAVSRDGAHFQRVNAHRPVIARGERSEWDSSFLIMGRTVLYHDRLHLYYSAGNENNSSWPSRNRVVGTGRSMAGYKYPGQMGLATLDLDGYTHLQARDGFGPGIVTTIPIRVEGPARAALQLNAKNLMPYRDWVECEILDAATGTPVAGYGKDDCLDVASPGNALRVAWRGVDTLRGVSVPAVKLRFYLYGKARLHAFVFAEKE